MEEGKIRELLDSDSEEGWALLVDYIKKDMRNRVQQVLLTINFDFMAPENYDNYVRMRDKVIELLEEKDGVIDTDKRERVRLLLKSIPRQKRK